MTAHVKSTLRGAVEEARDTNIAIISVPAQHAAREAHRALDWGLHVFLFSSGVSIEDELELKERAATQGLLVMGPDCGTAIIDGHPIGIANEVARGPIGIVGASGTGIQEVATLVHRFGGGISHAIGAGSRDLSLRIGGLTTLAALERLERDPATRVIVLTSKPPAGTVAHRVVERALATGKPVVTCFPGAPLESHDTIVTTSTLEDAAEAACRLVGVEHERESAPPFALERPFTAWQRDLVGLFSGGTLAYEALVTVSATLEVSSNLRYAGVHPLAERGHRILDLGDESLLGGGVHPILDPHERVRRIEELARDPGVAVLLIDVVLGHGAYVDPAGALLPALRLARSEATGRGGHLVIVASVTGTDLDPQDRSRQIEALEEAGVLVAPSSSAAARRAAEVLNVLARPIPALVKSADEAPPLLGAPLRAVNVGNETFADSLEARRVPVARVSWRPPAGGDDRLARILDKLR